MRRASCSRSRSHFRLRVHHHLSSCPRVSNAAIEKHTKAVNAGLNAVVLADLRCADKLADLLRYATLRHCSCLEWHRLEIPLDYSYTLTYSSHVFVIWSFNSYYLLLFLNVFLFLVPWYNSRLVLVLTCFYDYWPCFRFRTASVSRYCLSTTSFYFLKMRILLPDTL